MARRAYKRDRHGRFAKGAGRSAARKTARAVARGTGRRVRRSYVAGSFTRNLDVGQGGSYKGVKVGAEFRTPAGRGVAVKGIVGYQGRPERRLDVTPRLNKTKREFTVTVKKNPAGRRLKR
jgi:hypothetical protein